MSTSSLSQEPQLVSSGQTSITNFFRPLGLREASTNRMSIEAPIVKKQKIATSGTEACYSSDEDELASLECLFGREPQSKIISNQTTNRASSGTTSMLRHARESSPISDIPTFTGSFNLSALLADRLERNIQIEAISKLDQCEASSTGQAHAVNSQKGIKQIIGVSNSNVERLLQTGKNAKPVFWSVITSAEPMPEHNVRQTSVKVEDQKKACDRLLAKGCLISDTLYEDERTTTILELDKHFSRDQLGKSLICKLLATTDSNIAEDLSRLMARSLKFSSDLLHDACAILRIRAKSPDTQEHILTSVDQPPHYSDLKLKQIKVLVKELTTTVANPGLRLTSDTDQNVFVADVLRIAVALAMDDCMSGHLTIELERLLLVILRTHSLTQSIYQDLIGLAHQTVLAVSLTRIIPTCSPSALVFSEHLATAIFLELDPRDLFLITSKEEERLRQIKKHLNQSKLFSNISADTDYIELTDRIAVLSIAMATVPAGLGTAVLQIVEKLQKLHGQIIDGKAAFLDRSEAKASIQRLSDRLKYTVEAQMRKRSVFSAFV